jgi:predicted RNase H-like nuclease
LLHLQQQGKPVAMNDVGKVAGIDGCRAGWIVATTEGVEVMASLRLTGFSAIGIDMPIGLSDDARRTCDVEARAALQPRGSCVFPAPPRACLSSLDYRSALHTARQATGRGISVQTFNLIAKIGEVDRLIDATRPDRIIEVHPECAFMMLNHGSPLPSKKTARGCELRRRLLDDLFDVPVDPPRGSAVDDMLDAYAALWSTMRFQHGRHRTFGDGRRDARGIEMRIIC